MPVEPPSIEQLRKSLAAGLMYPGPMQDAASFLLSLVDEGGRLVVETPCEHGVFNPHYDGGSGLGCPGASRHVVWPTEEKERARWDDPAEVRAAVVPLLDLEAAAIRYYEGDEIRPKPPYWDDCTDGMKRWYRDESKAIVYAALGLGEDTEGGEK